MTPSKAASLWRLRCGGVLSCWCPFCRYPLGVKLYACDAILNRHTSWHTILPRGGRTTGQKETVWQNTIQMGNRRAAGTGWRIVMIRLKSDFARYGMSGLRIHGIPLQEQKLQTMVRTNASSPWGRMLFLLLYGSFGNASIIGSGRSLSSPGMILSPLKIGVISKK